MERVGTDEASQAFEELLSAASAEQLARFGTSGGPPDRAVRRGDVVNAPGLRINGKLGKSK